MWFLYPCFLEYHMFFELFSPINEFIIISINYELFKIILINDQTQISKNVTLYIYIYIYINSIVWFNGIFDKF